MTTENRKHPRLPFVDLVTLITPEERSYVSQSENVSLSGIFLVKENPLPVGTQGLLSMRINTDSTKKMISAKFRVIHTGTSQEGLAGMGVEFVDMSDDDQTTLKEILDKLPAE